MAAARWNPASRSDLTAFTFSSALLPDASAASLDPDPLPPRHLAAAWAAPASLGGSSCGDGGGGGCGGGAAAGQPGVPAAPQAQCAVAHGDRAVLTGGYSDGSLR